MGNFLELMVNDKNLQRIYLCQTERGLYVSFLWTWKEMAKHNIGREMTKFPPSSTSWGIGYGEGYKYFSKLYRINTLFKNE